MDYNKLKKGDFIYLFYYDVYRTRGSRSNATTVVTFKNSSERFYMFNEHEKKPHPTVAWEENPIVIFMWFAYFNFMAYIISPILNIYPILYYILVPILLIASYFFGRFPRLWFGVKKIDVSTLRKISIEEIKEKYMEKLWKSIRWPIVFVMLTIVLNINSYITSSEPIDAFFTFLTLPVFYIGYLDIINRLISMIKIEKEYKELKKDL